jgi:hypothetical protein
MVSVGRDLIMGLINGIKAMAGQVASAAKNLLIPMPKPSIVHTPYCLNNFEGEPICNALLAALTVAYRFTFKIIQTIRCMDYGRFRHRN